MICQICGKDIGSFVGNRGACCSQRPAFYTFFRSTESRYDTTCRETLRRYPPFSAVPLISYNTDKEVKNSVMKPPYQAIIPGKICEEALEFINENIYDGLLDIKSESVYIYPGGYAKLVSTYTYNIPDTGHIVTNSWNTLIVRVGLRYHTLNFYEDDITIEQSQQIESVYQDTFRVAEWFESNYDNIIEEEKRIQKENPGSFDFRNVMGALQYYDEHLRYNSKVSRLK